MTPRTPRALHRPSSEPAGTAPALVLLHGRGADEHDLFGLAGLFDPRFDVHSLRAPFEYEWGGYQWFRLFEEGRADMEGYARSRDAVRTYVAGLRPRRVVLLGFSMGAIMAHALSLTEPGFADGTAALSGFAPPQLAAQYRLDALNGMPVFIGHGTQDPVVPVSFARETHGLLLRSTAAVTYREYRAGHQITDECIDDLRRWLAALL